MDENLDDWEIEQLRNAYLESMDHSVNVERHEVVGGLSIQSAHPRGPRDGALAFGAYFHIYTYLQTRPRGEAFRPSNGFLLRRDPLTIRVPDVSYIEAHRLAQFDIAQVCELAPDLIVEVLCDNARVGEVEARIADFLAAGTSIAWLLDGRNETVEVRYASGQSRVFSDNQKVYSAPVLPRLNLPVYELFGG